MHYVGILGMELCGPVFSPVGVVIALLAAMVLSNLAVWVAYSARTRSNIVLGTACFAVAVVSMHFIAMAGTEFYPAIDTTTTGPALSNATLALIVALSSFVLSGASLLSGVFFLASSPPMENQVDRVPVAEHPVLTDAESEPARPSPLQVPYERNGRTQFAAASEIAAVRAEGHYTVLYTGDEKLFCPWSISEASERLGSRQFIRVHRSYLINPAYVREFQRTKDTGVCFFNNTRFLPKVPVSRSRLPDVRRALGI